MEFKIEDDTDDTADDIEVENDGIDEIVDIGKIIIESNENDIVEIDEDEPDEVREDPIILLIGKLELLIGKMGDLEKRIDDLEDENFRFSKELDDLKNNIDDLED